MILPGISGEKVVKALKPVSKWSASGTALITSTMHNVTLSSLISHRRPYRRCAFSMGMIPTM